MSVAARVHRYPSGDGVVVGVAEALVAHLRELQDTQDLVRLCLSGGKLPHRIYEAFAERATAGGLDTERLALWWSDERFVPTEDDGRHSQKALTALARTLSLDPRHVHAMPSADGRFDVFEAAERYTEVLPPEGFDLVMVGIGAHGHVGAMFPGHRATDSTHQVVGINDSPKPPSERIGLTLPALSQSRQVWLVAAGAAKAWATAEALRPATTLPAGRVHGTEQTHWFVDVDAASGLEYHHCTF